MRKSIILSVSALLVFGTVGTTVSAASAMGTEAAAAKEGWQLYESTFSGLYSIELPEDYFEMNTDTLNAIIANYGEDYFNSVGLDASMLEQMDFSNADYLYSENLVSNINVQVVKDTQVTQDMLADMKELMDEQITSTYTSLGIPEENCETMNIEEISGNTFYRFNVAIGEMSMHQYITCTENGDSLTLTFTSVDEEVEKTIIESFKLL